MIFLKYNQFVFMKPIAIGLSPNTFSQDIKLVIKLLLKPWQWQEGRDLVNLNSWLLFDSGRSALFSLLKAFGIGQGDEVLLQAFTCVAVPNPILWVGAKPIFVDIEKETLNMDVVDLKKKITEKSKAIVVQHTFGLPAPMNEILAIAKERHLIVIEDCAHALGAKYHGQEVGTLGDAAFFSFGRDKVIGVIAGGAATVSSRVNPSTLLKAGVQSSKLIGEYEKLNYPLEFWILQQLLYPLLSEVVLDTYNLGIGKLLHHIFLGAGIVPRANTLGEKKLAQKPSRIPSKMPNALKILMQEQFERLDEFNRRRNQIAQRYADAGLKSAQSDESGRIWLRFPMLIENPLELHMFAKRQNIFLGDWYDQVVAPKDVRLETVGYRMGMCPAAEEVSKHIINLPTYPKMTNLEVERLVGMVKDYGLLSTFP